MVIFPYKTVHWLRFIKCPFLALADLPSNGSRAYPTACNNLPVGGVIIVWIGCYFEMEKDDFLPLSVNFVYFRTSLRINKEQL